MGIRNIFAYTTPGADRPGFLSINNIDGEIVVSLRAEGGTCVDLKIPGHEFGKMVNRCTAEYMKPTGLPIRGS